jgi:hypothetical protein
LEKILAEQVKIVRFKSAHQELPFPSLKCIEVVLEGEYRGCWERFAEEGWSDVSVDETGTASFGISD